MKISLTINILYLILLSFTGCMKPAPTPPPGFSLRLYYTTANGADLLNPSTPGHYNKDSVNVLNRIIQNGVQAQTLAHRDSCSTYVCNPAQAGGLFYIRSVPSVNYVNSQQYNGTIIHLNSSMADTLTYETMPMNSGLGISKVLYKNKAVWTWSASSKFPTRITLTLVK